MQHFYDLSSYFTSRITALENEVRKKKDEIDKLTTFLFEVTDPECPEDYKKIVRREMVKETT